MIQSFYGIIMRVALPQKPLIRAEINHPYKPGQPLDKLDEMLAKGDITSYRQEGDHITVETTSSTDGKLLDKALTQPPTLPILAKASKLLIPPDMKENCAPEYLRFRAWQLGGAIFGGALGFVCAEISLKSLNLTFPNDAENAVLAGSIVGYGGMGASMAASFLAKKGDADPKKSYFQSGLLATAGTLATVGGLYLLPKQYYPFMLGATALGAIAGGLGGSAGLNICNHMAKEPARGTVGAKNGNQDRVANLFGVPLALGITHTAKALGLNPTMTAIGILGVGLLVCNLQSATALRFEAVDRHRLESLVGELLDGKTPSKVGGNQWDALKSLFKPAKEQDGQLKYLKSANPLLQQERIKTLANEDYLVGLDGNGRGQIAFRKNIGAEGLIQGVAQAQLLERCTPLLGAAEELAPGKGELLLTELSYRALPRGGNWKEIINQNGWHVHAEKLKVGSEDRWRATGGKFSPIPIENLTSLIAAPTSAGLRDLLKGSPLLSPK